MVVVWLCRVAQAKAAQVAVFVWEARTAWARLRVVMCQCRQEALRAVAQAACN